MAINVKKYDSQLQLSDSVKAQYPNSPIVLINFKDLLGVPDNLPDGQYLVAGPGGTVSSTAVAPGVGIDNGTDFPGAPSAGDIFLLTRAQGNNEVGVYQYTAGAWSPILTQSEDEDLPTGEQLPAQISGLFFLTATHLNNPPGVYAAIGGAWVRIAGTYSDTAVRALIAALTGRVATLEADNPIISVTLSGQTLTIRKKDGTTEDLNLPAAGQAGPSAPVTEDILFGLSAGIAAARDDSQASETAAAAAALAAYTANNQTPAQANVSGLNLTRTANPFSGGAYFSVSAPAAPADRYYNPWILIPSLNRSKVKFFDASGPSDGEDDTSNWIEGAAQIVNQVSYNFYARTLEIESGETMAFIAQVFR